MRRQSGTVAAMMVTVFCLLAVVRVGTAQAAFGFKSFSFAMSSAPAAGAGPGAVGPPDVQAGSHPYDVSVQFTLNETKDAKGHLVPAGAVKDLNIELPTGFIGNPTTLPHCLAEEFEQSELELQGCPANTQVGTLQLDSTSLDLTLPVFNLATPPGVPARFGVFAAVTPVVMDGSFRSGGAGGLNVELHNLPQFAALVGGTLHLWGVPADPRHDTLRGKCLRIDGLSAGECPSGAPLTPFLTLPGSCGAPPKARVTMDSWEEPGKFVGVEVAPEDSEGHQLALQGCERLQFGPSVEAQSESTTADTPAGFAVRLRLGGSESAGGLAAADLRDAVVSLPAGLTINPAVADGLEGCSAGQVGLEEADAPDCPNGSEIGSVEIDTPLLTRPLRGGVYLALPGNNPFGSTFAAYLVAEGEGVLLKLPARIEASATDGQLTLVLENAPQLPFSSLTLAFDGGPRAPLATPQVCGSFDVTAHFASYTGAAAMSTSPPIAIDSGCGGGFAPSFRAGATSALAGRSTGFSLQLTRSDGEQPIQSISASLPAGLLAHLPEVARCGEPMAAAGDCAAASEIGAVAVAAGAGSHPYYFSGRVFLTGRYDGAPFGLTIVVPAVAGPFDLGNVVVRGSITVDPANARLNIATGSLPGILDGLPLRVRGIYLTIERAGFMFDPTRCGQGVVSATAVGFGGARVSLSSPFGVVGCSQLPLVAKLSALAPAGVTLAEGAALKLTISRRAGIADNLRSVALTLPRQLAPRLHTIQTSCPQADLATSPASCPADSIVGRAAVSTPVLGAKLQGPIYLVSGGRVTLPRLALVLQGEGVRLQIVGSFRVARGGEVVARFESLPDVPISRLVLTLPKGPHSAFGASFLGKPKGSLCGRALWMRARLVAQNGEGVVSRTRVAIEGCKRRRLKGHGKRSGHRSRSRARGSGGPSDAHRRR